MKIKKLQLIFPPSSVDGTGIENSYVPNGILSLASFIKLNNPIIEIEVFDGNITSLDEILNNLGGKGRCLAACTRIIPFVEQLGYTGMIQVYPTCTVDTIENATKASKILYGSKIPVINVYKTNTCFK